MIWTFELLFSTLSTPANHLTMHIVTEAKQSMYANGHIDSVGGLSLNIPAQNPFATRNDSATASKLESSWRAVVTLGQNKRNKHHVNTYLGLAGNELYVIREECDFDENSKQRRLEVLRELIEKLRRNYQERLNLQTLGHVASVHGGQYVNAANAVEVYPSTLEYVGALEFEKSILIISKYLPAVELDKILPLIAGQGAEGSETATRRASISSQASRLIFVSPLSKGFLKAVLENLRNLHSIGISHRNLRPSTVLVSPGRAVRLSKVNELSPLYFDALESENEIWYAPEVLQISHALKSNVAFDASLSDDQWKKADIFSFGLLVYYLGTGRKPFSDANGVIRPSLITTASSSEQTYFRNIPMESFLQPMLRELCLECLKWNPNQRPTVEELLLSKNLGDHEQMSELIDNESLHEEHQGSVVNQPPLIVDFREEESLVTPEMMGECEAVVSATAPSPIFRPSNQPVRQFTQMDNENMKIQEAILQHISRLCGSDTPRVVPSLEPSVEIHQNSTSVNSIVRGGSRSTVAASIGGTTSKYYHASIIRNLLRELEKKDLPAESSATACLWAESSGLRSGARKSRDKRILFTISQDGSFNINMNNSVVVTNVIGRSSTTMNMSNGSLAKNPSLVVSVAVTAESPESQTSRIAGCLEHFRKRLPCANGEALGEYRVLFIALSVVVLFAIVIGISVGVAVARS